MGIGLTQTQADRLSRYGALIEKWNKSINLVSRSDIRRLDARHLLDSLAAVPYLTGNTLLDIGTGPGLPGIPLAIAEPNKTVTLWERMSRRVRFLQMVCRELELDNVCVHECDIERAGQIPEQECFDTIVARAVSSIEQLWPLMRKCLSVEGSLIVYSHVVAKADEERLPEFGNSDVSSVYSPAVPKLALSIREIPYTVPELSATHYLQMISNSALDAK